jgi:hypothetical protein
MTSAVGPSRQLALTLQLGRFRSELTWTDRRF